MTAWRVGPELGRTPRTPIYDGDELVAITDPWSAKFIVDLVTEFRGGSDKPADTATQDVVVYLTAPEVEALSTAFAAAARSLQRARVVVQDGGLKLSVAGRTWSLPYGSLDPLWAHL